MCFPPLPLVNGAKKAFFLRLTLLILLTVAAVAAGCSRSASPPLLRITFLDVGQGDCTIIEGPTGRVVLVDGGGTPGTDERDGTDVGSRTVVPFLRSRGISAIDLIVPTHPDDDHVQGLNAVVRRLEVRAALDGGFPGTSAPYQRLVENLRVRHIPVYRARRGQEIDLGGGAKMEILHPPNHVTGGTHSQTNNNSIVLRVLYNRARVLLTGDAEQEAEADILHTGRDVRADVLKAGHHGSRWSSSPAFLDAVQPRAVVVSCGKNNTYNHPHKETLDRYALRRIAVFRTDQSGAIVLTSDGTTFHLATTVKAQQ